MQNQYDEEKNYLVKGDDVWKKSKQGINKKKTIEFQAE